MLTQESAIKKVEKFAREIKASGIHLRRVVLFGSYAHGEPTKLSDIDVSLAADEFTYDEFNNTRYFVRIKRKPGYAIISTHTYNTKDFTSRLDPFVEVIMEKGIEIKNF